MFVKRWDFPGLARTGHVCSHVGGAEKNGTKMPWLRPGWSLAGPWLVRLPHFKGGN